MSIFCIAKYKVSGKKVVTFTTQGLYCPSSREVSHGLVHE